jgi:hypothetical protein
MNWPIYNLMVTKRQRCVEDSSGDHVVLPVATYAPHLIEREGRGQKVERGELSSTADATNFGRYSLSLLLLSKYLNGFPQIF